LGSRRSPELSATSNTGTPSSLYSSSGCWSGEGFTRSGSPRRNFHEFRPPRQRAKRSQPRPPPKEGSFGAPGGRLSVAHEFQPLHPRFYIPLALAVVAAAFAIVRLARPDDRYLQGEVLYGSIALVWIAIPAWLAYRHGRWVPYATLFRTIQDLESHLRTAAIVVAGGILILLVHLAFYPWPASIPDMQDLHKQFDKQRHEQKKEKEPPPNAL
jgi:hypothetical protein